MALTQKLEFRQTQALVMTPQLMQAIKLLQLSNLDLAAYVEHELERNPLLERTAEGEEAGAHGNPDGQGAAPSAEPPASDAQSSDWPSQELETSRSAIEDRFDTGLENVFPDDAPARAEPTTRAADPAGYSEWSGVGVGGRDQG